MAPDPSPTRAAATVSTPAPMSQRRQGLLRALLAVVGIGGSAVALPFIFGGIGALRRDRPNGGTILAIGIVILVASILVPIVVKRLWGTALTAVHDPALVLPFGAKRRGSGVTLRPRAAVRVAPGFAVALMLLTVLGMSLDGVNPIAVWIVACLTVIVFVGWLWLRSYEVCLDSAGVWRRRRPRWRLAWQDLEWTETVVTPKHPNQVRPDDLVLHGLVARPRGRTTRSVRLRMNLLAISLEDIQRLADHFADQPRGAMVSPFDRWS